MRKRIILSTAALLMLAPAVMFSQFKKVVVEEVDNGGKVPGRTYRIYAEMTNVKDQVYIIYGDTTHHLEIKSTRPFYQCREGGATAKNVNRRSSELNDSLKYDSWVTIGAHDNYDNNLNILAVNFDEFETKGGPIVVSKDGAWFCVPTDKQAFCKEDKKVLLMQLTTQGTVSGKFSIMGKTVEGEQYKFDDVTFTCGEKKRK